MPDDTTKKADPSQQAPRKSDKIEELPQEQVVERDAQSVKGGGPIRRPT